MTRWLALLLVCSSASATPFEEPTLRALRDELARSIAKLELPSSGKPYYLAYSMWNLRRARVDASFGALTATDLSPQRTVDIDLRLGDATFDNSNLAGSERDRSITLPAEDDYDAVRRTLWLATDHAYKTAIQQLERKRAIVNSEAKNPDDAGALSKEAPSHIVSERAVPGLDLARLEKLATQMSAVFRANPDVHGGTVSISAAEGKHYFVSSEGSASVQTAEFVRIDVECHTQAEDGMALHDGFVVWAHELDQLPPDTELVAQVDKLSKELSALRKAPVVDDYSGPIVMRGIAPAQVVRSLLAENFAGTPAPKGDRAGTRGIGETELAGKVNQRILPLGVSVVDDPTIDKLGKLLLTGGSRFDEEGMPSQKVVVVENGTFKRFLMSRTPRKGFEHSNGHAVSTPYSGTRAHPANLIVTSSAGLSDAELAQRARAAAKQQGLAYYLVVDRLAQRHYSDDATSPLAETTIPAPAVMRRVFLDGREELVRGGTFGAFPMRTLRDVLAFGSTLTAYNYLGSGLPERYAMMFGDSPNGFLATIVAPGMVFRDVDVKKPIGAHKQPPIAPRPVP